MNALKWRKNNVVNKFIIVNMLLQHFLFAFIDEKIIYIHDIFIHNIINQKYSFFGQHFNWPNLLYPLLNG